MFLADAVAGYVTSLTERELDEPLIAVLRSCGFTRVHLVHGQYEFGKDIIARRVEDGVETQFCLQSKAGDLNARSWREVRLQVDAMRTGTIVHPDFDPALDRRLVVVTNGRLVGGAAVEFQDYNAHHRSRAEATAELWDIDTLAPMFYDVLIEGVSARERSRTLELLGQVGSGRGTTTLIRGYAAPWYDSALTIRDRWGNVLTAALLAREATGAGREDLAAQLTYHLIRTTWELGDVPDAEAQRRVARAMFAQTARTVWDRVKGMTANELVQATLSDSPGFTAFLTHSARVARLCETISMLGLLELLDQPGEDADARQPDLESPHQMATWIADLFNATPALAHPISDEYAFSVLASCVFLHATGHNVERILRTTAVWILDRIEFADGIAEPGASVTDTVRVLLGSPYPSLRKAGRNDSYLATVVLDIARAVGAEQLAADLINDLDAVGGYASIIRGYPPAPASLVARLSYDELSEAPGQPAAAHYADGLDIMPAAAASVWFDVLATWATLRDRHTPAVLRALLEALTARAPLANSED